MIRYKNIGTVAISIDLKNGFEVVAIANYNKDSKNYQVSLYLKDNQIDTLDLMEKFENIHFKSDKNHIKINLASYILDLFQNNEFTYYIERYEYQQRCFEYGNDYYNDNPVRY